MKATLDSSFSRSLKKCFEHLYLRSKKKESRQESVTFSYLHQMTILQGDPPILG